MIISKKVADILLTAAEKYLASLPEEERNQILSHALENSKQPAIKRTASSKTSY